VNKKRKIKVKYGIKIKKKIRGRFYFYLYSSFLGLPIEFITAPNLYCFVTFSKKSSLPITTHPPPTPPLKGGEDIN
jgi:hypothetical protein